jgi:alpha-beta hydrolase superfamily lysophospholipase
MGGLMALRLLLRQPDLVHAAWVSSPLLRVGDRAGPWLRPVLPFLAKIAPRLTVDTGVTDEQCGDLSKGFRSEDPDQEALYHNRISLGWGVALCEASDFVREKITDLPAEKPILFTQGEEDVVCPPEALTELLSKTPSRRAHLKLLAGSRHEPFSGSTRGDLLERLDLWISEELTPSKIPPPGNPRQA